MAHDSYCCGSPRRRALVRDARNDDGDPFLNGIDYLDVDPADQRTLHVHFIHAAPGETDGVPPAPPLTAANFAIDGGVRERGIRVAAIVDAADRVVTIRTDRTGDLSEYTLHLVASPTAPAPPVGFDPVLSSVGFSFKVNCPSEADCRDASACAPSVLPAPYLNYLAKDYATFRRLMLDRLSVTLPDWRERNPADIGVALVEMLAYTADQLSYYQDAVATEAYLATSRRRTSVRRHGRLVDYHLHEGSNARAWLVFDTDADRGNIAAPALRPSTRVTTDAAEPADRIVFETLQGITTLLVSQNAIAFHTWGEPRCCLPAGSTTATLAASASELGLSRGDVLVFEEVLGATSGRPEDADRTHRHVVRLSADPRDRVDPLTGASVTDIRWHEQDALPFVLCLFEFDDGHGGVRQASVARGNVVLADHGATVDWDAAPDALVPARVPQAGAYRPVLGATGLTHARPFDEARAGQRPAADALQVDPRATLPVIVLRGEGETWQPRRDLLTSARFAPDFVVETEAGGEARLRFGDGTLGRAPLAGTRFRTRFRIGHGAAGNVAADALTIVDPPIRGVRVRNPLMATGGVDPEPTREAKLYAPQAFRTQERAVTAADYAEVAGRHPEVQRAAATRRWTGSWHTMFVTIDRRGGRPVDAAFEAEIRHFLERFRMAGYDLEIDAPRFVPLDVALRLCVGPHVYRAAVHQALRRSFSAGTAQDGTSGFFHPDNFTFGQPVVLSQIVARAMDAPGVQAVLDVARFQRYGEAAHDEISRGFVPMHRLEIARLDNDPSARERGRIEFLLEGGL